MALYLGLDGGASKTAGVLLGGDGRVLAARRGPASAVLGEPKEGPKQVLKAMVDGLLEDAGATRADLGPVGLGLNGIDYADETPLQRRSLAEAMGLAEDRLLLFNDAIPALWGSTESPRAVMVQHGSGYTSAWRARFGAESLFDHLNVGAIFDLRGELVRTVARMIDGREAATPLKDRTLAWFGVKEADFAEHWFRRDLPWEKRLHTPPLVYQAWQDGDPAARGLVEKAADDYALAARTMAAGMGPGDPAVLSFGGGVIVQAPRQFWSLLTDRLKDSCPGSLVQGPRYPAEYGAAFMAAWNDGKELKGFFDMASKPREFFRPGRGPMDCV